MNSPTLPSFHLVGRMKTDAVWPFGDGAVRAALYRARCEAFTLRAARIVATLDDTLELLRGDNKRPQQNAQGPAFFFKSQPPGAPLNPAFEQKHPRKGGKFAPRSTAQAGAGARPKAQLAPRGVNLSGLVLPKSRGRWIGVRGNGVWLPRSLKARAIAPQGVEFRAGFPVFEPHLHHIEKQDETGQKVEVAGEVEMPAGFVGERAKDFAVADRLIAQRMGWLKRDGTPNAARAERYRVENRLVWHHHEDCARPRMLLIPAVVHARAPHSGGHSLCAPKVA